jgi:hypothetical protein
MRRIKIHSSAALPIDFWRVSDLIIFNFMPFIFSFRCHAQIKPFTPRASIVVGRHKNFTGCSSAIKRTMPINASASIVCGCLLLFYVVPRSFAHQPDALNDKKHCTEGRSWQRNKRGLGEVDCDAN